MFLVRWKSTGSVTVKLKNLLKIVESFFIGAGAGAGVDKTTEAGKKN